MSGFGYFVMELLARRHLNRQSELAMALRTHPEGFDVKSPQKLSTWLNGTPPPPEFVRALVRVFELTPEEETMLNWKFVNESRRSA